MKKYKFYNLDLTHNQQTDIIEYAEARSSATSDEIQTAVEQSMKVSFSYDNYHNCVLMSLTPKDENHSFYGFIVSIRHTDIHTLVKTLFWLMATDWVEVDDPNKGKAKYDW